MASILNAQPPYVSPETEQCGVCTQQLTSVHPLRQEVFHEIACVVIDIWMGMNQIKVGINCLNLSMNQLSTKSLWIRYNWTL